jgi:hypothetical protein
MLHVIGTIIIIWLVAKAIDGMMQAHADYTARRIDEYARQRERERQLHEFNNRPKMWEEHREHRTISNSEWTRMCREDEERAKALTWLEKRAEEDRKRAIAFQKYKAVLEIEMQHAQQRWSRIWANTAVANTPSPFLQHCAEEVLRNKLKQVETIRSLLQGMSSDDKAAGVVGVLVPSVDRKMIKGAVLCVAA